MNNALLWRKVWCRHRPLHLRRVPISWGWSQRCISAHLPAQLVGSLPLLLFLFGEKHLLLDQGLLFCSILESCLSLSYSLLLNNFLGFTLLLLLLEHFIHHRCFPLLLCLDLAFFQLEPHLQLVHLFSVPFLLCQFCCTHLSPVLLLFCLL